jgi:hypothetical protein
MSLPRWAPSSRRESHPPALTDPYVTVSRHTALIALTSRRNTFHRLLPLHPAHPGTPVGHTKRPRTTRPLRSTAITTAFITTTSRSASVPGHGTQSLTASHRLRHSLSTPAHQQRNQYPDTPSPVPYESSRPGSRHLHAGHRLASTSGTRQTHPGTSYDPRFRCHLIDNDTSTMIVFLIPT